MSDLTYTLLSDGSSDSALMPIPDWLLRANGIACAIQGQWADLRWLHRPPKGLAARLSTAVDLFPCELLFIHRDGERDPYDSRRNEIRSAVAEAFDRGHTPIHVCVIPIRMREAWLLFDEAAIRRAAGNPSGRVAVQLPPLGRCEDVPDPKGLLHHVLREASGLSARRRAQLRLGPLVRRVAEHTQDFAPLRALTAFAALERDVQEAIAVNRWDQRQP